MASSTWRLNSSTLIPARSAASGSEYPFTAASYPPLSGERRCVQSHRARNALELHRPDVAERGGRAASESTTAWLTIACPARAYAAIRAATLTVGP